VKIRNRITKLEQRLLGGRGGCRACRERRGQVVLITARKSADGNVVPDEPEPEPCPSCGEPPEQLIVVIKEVVASRNEISQSEAG
jgi:hypothetical protein